MDRKYNYMIVPRTAFLIFLRLLFVFDASRRAEDNPRTRRTNSNFLRIFPHRDNYLGDDLLSVALVGTFGKTL